MPLKFCPNLSFLFTEHEDIAERYLEASRLGFKGVEICFPYDWEYDKMLQLKKNASVKTILINSYPGKSFGYAAVPGKDKDFKDSMEKSLKYADALDVKRLHIMSGVVSGVSRDECYETLERNLRSIISDLQTRNIVGVIEPINKKTIPGYFLNNYKEALQLVKKIDSPFVRLQLDIFHLQQIQGDLTAFIDEAMPFVGHVQIAQVPNRNEPDDDGEINYPHVLNQLLRHNYDGWIGMEYKPKNGTINGLDWIKCYSN